MTVTRQDCLARLHHQISIGSPILAVGAGNGLVARCAEAGNADLVVVYNSGHFRLNGLPSFVGNLPVGDANALMLEMGARSILPAVRSVPVIGGVYAIDPTRNVDQVLDEMQRIGYSGVINFPTVGRLDGLFRRELEASGYGFAREVEMVRKARERDMLSMAYVFCDQEAADMARAGVDVVVGHVGLTGGGDVGSGLTRSLEQAVTDLRQIFAAARSERADVLLLSHGGPIATPADARYVNERCGAVGFVAASSIERLPVEAVIKSTCNEFKSGGHATALMS